MMSLSRWKAQIGFACAILTILTLGLLSYWAWVASIERDRGVQHTYEVLERLQDILSSMKSMDSAARGFILTGEDAFLDTYRIEQGSVPKSEANFRVLTADNPTQQNRAAALNGLMTTTIQRLDTLIALRQSQGLKATTDVIRTGSGLPMMRDFDGLVDEAQGEELRLLSSRRAASERQATWTIGLLTFGTLFGSMMAGVAGWSIHRDSIRRRMAETALSDEKERFQTMANNISQLAWMADAKGSIFWFNARWFEFTGFTPQQMAGSYWRQRVHHPDHMRRVIDKLHGCFQSGEEWEDTFPLLGQDGTYHWFLSRGVAVRDAQGQVLRWFATSTDITENKLLEEALFEARERAQVTLDSIGDAVACTDTDGNITFLNFIAEVMTGWSSRDAAGQPMGTVLQIVNGATREPIQNPMERAASLDRAVALPPNSVLIRRDGGETPIADSVAPIHDRLGNVTGAVIVFRDVSEAQAMALQLTHSARHDFLTGLPNRMLLTDRIGQAIALAPRHAKKVAVLFLDLDGFKAINDTLGHAVGDKLLQSIAARLQGCVRASDTVARLGGDEFVALLSEVDSADDAALCAKRMLQAVAAEHMIDEHRLVVTTSIGISLFPDDSADATTLVSNADAAMYASKQSGKQAFTFFAPAKTSLMLHPVAEAEPVCDAEEPEVEALARRMASA